MSSNSTFISVSNQKRWILEIDSNFSKEHVVDIDSRYPTCVFRVSKTLSETKPEAYAPQQIGLGPYHHLRPEFYEMQKNKISAIKKFLGEEKLHVFNQVVTTLIKWELVVRACYDQYLDFHITTLARILAIDILYMLQLFIARKSAEVADQKLVGDIMMLENQIPTILLEKIRDDLISNKICEPGRGEHVLSKEFQEFCEDYSPLELEEIMFPRELHLLHHMYLLIVENRGGFSQAAILAETIIGIEEFAEDVSTYFQIVGVPLGAALPGQILAIVGRVKRILGLIKKEEIPSVQEISIPTVSEMSETVGIQFQCTHGGIRDIEYEGDKKIFNLPSIRPNANSEVILRNLIAFEAASTKTGSTRELASYVDLMCAIIKATKDVRILKTANIIKGEVADEEVVRIFNAMRKSTGENNKQPLYIEKAIDNVSKIYNDVRSVKVKRFLKKYFKATWKFITVVVAVVVVVLLTLQGLCSLFGCARWFGKAITVQGFHFLYADQ